MISTVDEHRCRLIVRVFRCDRRRVVQIVMRRFVLVELRPMQIVGVADGGVGIADEMTG